MMIFSFQPVFALLAGILILMIPRSLNYIVEEEVRGAAYRIIAGKRDLFRHRRRHCAHHPLAEGRRTTDPDGIQRLPRGAGIPGGVPVTAEADRVGRRHPRAEAGGLGR